MTDLVQSVHGHPAKRPAEPLGIVVHDAPTPVFGRQAREVIREQVCRLTELARDSSWVLLGVAVVLDALVASHRLEGRVIYAARRKHSFTLNEQHVTHVAAVLKG